MTNIIPSVSDSLRLEVPSAKLCAHYIEALKHGWNQKPDGSYDPDNPEDVKKYLSPENAKRKIAEIQNGREAFVNQIIRQIEWPDKFPDVSRENYWLYNGSGNFVGEIFLRRNNGKTELPENMGHCGYGIIELFRGRKYAQKALHLIIQKARDVGLDFITLRTDTDNKASAAIILKVMAEMGGEMTPNTLLPNNQHTLQSPPKVTRHFYKIRTTDDPSATIFLIDPHGHAEPKPIGATEAREILGLNADRGPSRPTPSPRGQKLVR